MVNMIHISCITIHAPSNIEILNKKKHSSPELLINQFRCLRNERKHLEELSPGDGAANAHGNIMKGKDQLVNIVMMMFSQITTVQGVQGGKRF